MSKTLLRVSFLVLIVVPLLHLHCTNSTGFPFISLQNIVATLMYDVFHHRCPAYLQNLVTFTDSARSRLRSSTIPDLLSQSGWGRNLEVALFQSLDLPRGTVYRLNFCSSTVVLSPFHIRRLSGDCRRKSYFRFVSYYECRLFLSKSDLLINVVWT